VAAQDLLDKVIEAHGGLARFQATREVALTIRSGGFAFVMRRQRASLPVFEVRATTSEPSLVISPYPQAGRRGRFEPSRVWIESDDGALIAERENPRTAFRSLRRQFRWDDLDLLYFAGYATWNYVSAPFMFTRPGFELTELDAWEEDGERWRRLRVLFPDDIPTHSAEQHFYFDEQGLLRRLDYTAEVFGNWAKAAHYCWDHKPFDGLVVPTRRKVFPRRRNNRSRSRPTLVWLQVQAVTLVPASVPSPT
jgi:hypothetical protein